MLALVNLIATTRGKRKQYFGCVRFAIFLALFYLSLLKAVAATENGEQCGSSLAEQELATTQATIAALANLRGASNAMRIVAENLLKRATDTVDVAPRECPPSCEPASPTIVFQVRPHAFLDDTQQNATCIELEKKTLDEPLRFSDRQFATVDEMNSWIMRFSRGRGQDGKSLYRACGLNCSPRYSFRIRKLEGGGFTLSSDVICGRARDRSIPDYDLSTVLQQRCQAAENIETSAGKHDD